MHRQIITMGLVSVALMAAGCGDPPTSEEKQGEGEPIPGLYGGEAEEHAEDPPFDYTAIDAATFHQTCGVTTDGDIVCAGSESSDRGYAFIEGNYTAISVGQGNICALTRSGRAHCTGVGVYGRGEKSYANFAQVSAANNLSCVRTTEGNVACYTGIGMDEHGLGQPPEVEATWVSAGPNQFACLVTAAGRARCWGKLPWEDDEEVAGIPSETTFRQLSVGYSHVCGVTTDDTVECWGGIVETGAADPPDGSFVQVSAGRAHTCGVTTAGTATCWGIGSDPDKEESQTAAFAQDHDQAVPPDGNFEAVAAGGAHTCGLRPSGEVECWGEDHELTRLP